MIMQYQQPVDKLTDVSEQVHPLRGDRSHIGRRNQIVIITINTRFSVS